MTIELTKREFTDIILFLDSVTRMIQAGYIEDDQGERLTEEASKLFGVLTREES